MRPIRDFIPANPFFLAPLAGITDAPTRLLAKEMGAALVYTEMVSAKGMYYGNKNSDGLLRIDPDEKPAAIQLFGAEPDMIAWAARFLRDRDHAILDLNMGCPVPKVVKNGEGSALMKDPEAVRRLVAAAVENAGRPVTVKIRSGWNDAAVNAPEIALAAQEAGAAAVAVHGRTREQFYAGKADWSVISRVVEAVDVPVIGSGDVFSGADALRMMEDTGCDYVMIARGALGNPWIIREALALYEGRPSSAPPGIAEKIRVIRRHLDLAVREKGERVAVMELRKHLGWYLKGEPGSAALRKRANGLETAGDFAAFLEDLAAHA